MTKDYKNKSPLRNNGKTKPNKPDQTRFDERSEASPILSSISLFSLFTFYSLFFLSPTPNYFPNNYLRKNVVPNSAQFRQFGAPFENHSRTIREQFETIGAISRQNTKNFPRLNLHAWCEFVWRNDWPDPSFWTKSKGYLFKPNRCYLWIELESLSAKSVFSVLRILYSSKAESLSPVDK